VIELAGSQLSGLFLATGELISVTVALPLSTIPPPLAAAVKIAPLPWRKFSLLTVTVPSSTSRMVNAAVPGA
jgi:hypothetical protein